MLLASALLTSSAFLTASGFGSTTRDYGRLRRIQGIADPLFIYTNGTAPLLAEAIWDVVSSPSDPWEPSASLASRELFRELFLSLPENGNEVVKVLFLEEVHHADLSCNLS
uniref:Ras-GEF domain-containing protein n=1 Tax=Steinernema glaseri TaxID=37863 RepID=A0A1I7ZEX8_9BILA